MTVATPVGAIVNPNNTAQRYILWGNGRIDAQGGAAPITSGPAFFDRADQPVCVAIWITNWTTGAGYALDYQGGFQPLNGAPTITTVGSTATTNSNGLPYVAGRQYVDWDWDPAQNGQGYALTAYGELVPFGGAVAPPRTGARWGQPVARKFAMQWGATKKAITVDYQGGLHTDFAATIASIGAWWPGWDAARDIVVTNWTTGAGYVLDLFGGVQPFGGAVNAYGGPYQVGPDIARVLVVLSASNPLRLWSIWAGGQQGEWAASTAPTVTAGGVGTLSPAATTTSTTRPVLIWAYSDPQSDSQAGWEVYLYTQTWVAAHTMTDPSLWAANATFFDSGVDPGRRGVTSPVDLTNQAYRFYVRARDTSGLWSAWSNYGWTQNVTPPPAPTALTVTPNQALWRVALQVTATTTSNADAIRFEVSDDGGTTWDPVRGADNVPIGTTVTATDYDTPLGVAVRYRAVAFNDDPRVISAYTATSAAVTLTNRKYVLTATSDPALGGEVRIVEAPSWTRESKAGVFQGAGAKFPTVVSDGQLKARKGSITIECNGVAEWNTVFALANANSTLVYRDQFGDVGYFRIVGDVGQKMQKLPPMVGEGTYPLGDRHNHLVPMPLVEIAPPTSLAVRNTVPPGPVLP
jgi:hypothetical protein